jgi:hypothetical protein
MAKFRELVGGSDACWAGADDADGVGHDVVISK